MNSDFSLDGGTGLASVLKGNLLRVPLNQREYRWEKDNVLDMLQDLANAMRNNLASHFMGTVVLTKKGEEEWEIADGQQRLATTTIFLAALRDLNLEIGSDKLATGYEQEFLFSIDPESAEEIARLKLNADDNDFFLRKILVRPKERADLAMRRASHERLMGCYDTARKYFSALRDKFGKGFPDALLQWRKYLLTGAKVLVLKVPDSRLAFVMFETLNDRGIKTSEVDLIKNHLFEIAESGKRIDEAQRAWSSMRGIIESISERDDVMMDFFRCAACALFGITREKEIFDRISDESKTPRQAIATLEGLEGMANDYSALFNPEHPKWNDYSPEILASIKMLKDLEVKQMRPLLLSIAKNFTPAQAVTAFKGLISWAVRLTVAGGTKAGRLDTFYATLAHLVQAEKVKNYTQLLGQAGDVIPTDAEFRSYFETIRVRVAWTARYYLRSLEKTYLRSLEKNPKSAKEPAWVHNEDATAVNLEHVMPKTQSPAWPYVTAQDIETHAHRLGNLALIQAPDNVLSDRDEFHKKKPILRTCPYPLTSMIADNFNEWGTKEIEARQKWLAQYAPATWPI